MYEGDDLNTLDDAPPPEESGNKTFLLVAAVLGGIVLLSIACLAVYGLYYLPRQTATRDNQQATLVAQNLQVNQALTEKAISDLLSQVPEPSATLPPTNTPVIQQATATVAPADPQTATVAAALTQAAQAQLTVTGMPTSTLLPNTGFIDDVGAPGLVVMAIALVIVILLARRLRISPAK
jgi:Tfp pilus assembly protein PilN